MTFLPAQIHGRWFHFYLILDIRSRAIVGFEGLATDSADHAACLAGRTALADVHAAPLKTVLCAGIEPVVIAPSTRQR